ncbi:solute carrier family 66 member 3 [Tachyglossus aculeatus]|uniref:solute carrier family 66 member 3 n=1 Tax=Tachyglossus aculeatus TaxID=9261 RepID=UPI0018F51B20|nr:solute carrier family 66 member 3 [Tachyglossus aculeatus]
MMEGMLLAWANWSTLLVCLLLKIPQIVALRAARTSRGVSRRSLLLELGGFLVFLRYQSYYDYPLITYLEYPILIAQDIVVLLCVFHFDGHVNQALPYLAGFLVGWYLLTLQKWIIDLAMNLCTFISAASKFAQLQCLWETRDSGAVSALTWGMSAYTCATRIVTTLMTTKDLMVLVRFVVMLVLNIWVTATVLRYRKTTTKAD